MKCPSCGRENGPTNRFCIFCGSPLPVPRPEEPAQAEEKEYKDDEKVRYKTRAKLSLPHKEPEEADCFVTEGHVVIEATERIKIPLSRIKDYVILYPSISYYPPPKQSLYDSVRLTFVDELNRKHKLSLEMATGGPSYYFKQAIEAIDEQMAEHREVMSDFAKALWATAFPIVALSLVSIVGGNIFREFYSVGLAAVGLWVLAGVAAIFFDHRGEKRIAAGMWVGIVIGIISLGVVGLVIMEISLSGY